MTEHYDNEYTRLLVLLKAIEGLESLEMPINIIKEQVIPLKDYVVGVLSSYEVVHNG